jgi:PAS domain S-box-containing protein
MRNFYFMIIISQITLFAKDDCNPSEIVIQSQNELYVSLALAIMTSVIVFYLLFTNKKLKELYLEKEEANENFKMLLDNILEAVVIMDNETKKLVNANRRAQELLLISKEELISRDMLNFVEEEYIEKVKLSIAKAHVEPYELQLIKADGTVFFALVSGQNYHYKDKSLRLITIMDLTDIKEKEHILAHQSKMASMGEMIGNIAHQWRQPIATVSMQVNNMLADIDLEDVDFDEFRKNLLAINTQNQHLSKTIDDFRNFFTDDKEEAKFDIKIAIEESLNLVKASFKNSNIDLIINLQSIPFFGIKNELTQAFINILNNAKDVLVNSVDKKEDRVIFIECGYSKVDTIFITIKDNGGGVDENIIDKIFEPYFTTKHKSQGTGIGLYMTSEIICKHLQGKISVVNEVFEYNSNAYTGAKFNIEIPLRVS